VKTLKVDFLFDGPSSVLRLGTLVSVLLEARMHVFADVEVLGHTKQRTSSVRPLRDGIETRRILRPDELEGVVKLARLSRVLRIRGYLATPPDEVAYPPTMRDLWGECHRPERGQADLSICIESDGQFVLLWMSDRVTPVVQESVKAALLK